MLAEKVGSNYAARYVWSPVYVDAMVLRDTNADDTLDERLWVQQDAYDGQGNAYLVTGYNAASSGSVVNQVERAFNGLGQMTTEWQEHSGAVNTSTSTKVQYVCRTELWSRFLPNCRGMDLAA